MQIKKLLPKKYLVAGAVLFVLLVGAALVPRSSVPSSRSQAVPAGVIVSKAEAVGRGVEVAWLKAQGPHPIRGYIVERSRAGSPFAEIGSTEGAEGLSFLDAEGRAGDSYRIIAEDAREGRSRPGHALAAVTARPGDNVVMAPASSTPYILGTSTVDRSSPPELQASSLHALATQALTDLHAAFDRNQKDSVGGILTAVQEYYRQILVLFPQLSQAQKHSFAQSCEEQAAKLEASIGAIPEKYHMDALMVVASCHAIEGAAA